MIDPFNINSIPLPTPPTGAMALIPQIWADILEKSLRKQMDILYQLPFAHI